MTVGLVHRIAFLIVATACMCVGLPARAAFKDGAVNVAIYGFEYPQNVGMAITTLEANGFGATSVGLVEISQGLVGYDVLYVTHPFDFGGWSVPACTGLKTFLASGKG